MEDRVRTAERALAHPDANEDPDIEVTGESMAHTPFPSYTHLREMPASPFASPSGRTGPWAVPAASYCDPWRRQRTPLDEHGPFGPYRRAPPSVGWGETSTPGGHGPPPLGHIDGPGVWVGSWNPWLAEDVSRPLWQLGQRRRVRLGRGYIGSSFPPPQDSFSLAVQSLSVDSKRERNLTRLYTQNRRRSPG